MTNCKYLAKVSGTCVDVYWVTDSSVVFCWWNEDRLEGFRGLTLWDTLEPSVTCV